MGKLAASLPAHNDPSLNPAEIAAQKGFINGPNDTTTTLTAQQQAEVDQTIEDNEEHAEDTASDAALDELHGE